ncbi:nucleoside monophosphate kinase [Candidatus Parcubacteria bacterium]|nr:nucleoside monophosphate kinase [Candidatus Parcubacteria bacterium]
MTPQTFLFMGRSGCGKGTQSKLLSGYLTAQDGRSVYHLEAGPEFRKFFAGEGYPHALSRKLNDVGELQPEFLSVSIWSKLLLENLKEDQHLIVDGAARRYHECGVLDSAFEFYGRETPFVVHVDVSREWSRARMLGRARSDDTMLPIERRLEWFETEVVPAMEFFRENPKYRFITVNGEQSIEAVHAEIVAAIAPHFTHGAH